MDTAFWALITSGSFPPFGAVGSLKMAPDVFPVENCLEMGLKPRKLEEEEEKREEEKRELEEDERIKEERTAPRPE